MQVRVSCLESAQLGRRLLQQAVVVALEVDRVDVGRPTQLDQPPATLVLQAHQALAPCGYDPELAQPPSEDDERLGAELDASVRAYADRSGDHPPAV